VGAGKQWSKTTIDSDTLVARLRAPDDQEAWRIVDARYGPLLLAFAARTGLDAERCRDARQEAMMAFAETIRAGRFDRSRGRLRDLLFAIAKNKVADIHVRRRREPAPLSVELGAVDPVAGFADDEAWRRAWEAEWQLAVAAECLRQAQLKFKPDTYLAFYLKAIEGYSSVEVAGRTGKTVNAVDIATTRVRSFLREIRGVIEEVF
jgi:RNA polymerase sigma factor (sigma-70 family)